MTDELKHIMRERDEARKNFGTCLATAAKFEEECRLLREQLADAHMRINEALKANGVELHPRVAAILRARTHGE